MAQWSPQPALWLILKLLWADVSSFTHVASRFTFKNESVGPPWTAWHPSASIFSSALSSCRLCPSFLNTLGFAVPRGVNSGSWCCFQTIFLLCRAVQPKGFLLSAPLLCSLACTSDIYQLLGQTPLVLSALAPGAVPPPKRRAVERLIEPKIMATVLIPRWHPFSNGT